MLRFALVFAALVLLGACALFREKPPKAMPISFPKGNVSDGTKREPRSAGRIFMVNAPGKFVLIDAAALVAPEPGTALKCLRSGAEVGVLTVSRERRGGMVVADIVTGMPQKGDEVFQ